MAATLIQEDGTQVASSNTYVTAAELDTYADERGKTISGTQADLLIQAMDYLEVQPFKGFRKTNTQSLSWPRTDVYIDGWLQASNTIPQELKDAQAEIAIAIDEGYSPFARIDRKTKREKVGSLEVEYSDSAANNPQVQTIWLKLQKVINSNYGVIRV